MHVCFLCAVYFCHMGTQSDIDKASCWLRTLADTAAMKTAAWLEVLFGSARIFKSNSKAWMRCFQDSVWKQNGFHKKTHIPDSVGLMHARGHIFSLKHVAQTEYMHSYSASTCAS